jgi:ABC-type glycerol-3-phosphate transport system substrate-binding protein
VGILAGTLPPLALAACLKPIQVERVVEREVTKIVRETVVVAGTPLVMEKAVEKVVTVTPAPIPSSRAPTVITADVMDYGWTRLGQQLTPAFQELFPHVAIVWRSPTLWPEYPQRIAALAASGQVGDIIEAPPGAMLAGWALQGVTQPLDDVIAAENVDTDAFLGGTLRACRHGNAQIGLPFVAHPGPALLLFRPESFQHAEIEPPTNDWALDDLQEAGLALAPQFGIALTAQLPAAYAWLDLFGASLLSADGRRCALQNEAGLACLQWLHDQTQHHRTAPAPHEIVRGPLHMLQSGRAATLRETFRTLTQIALLRDTAPQVDATLFPRHSSGSVRRGALASGMAYAITRQSTLAREALQWVKFMSSRETGVQMLLAGYGEPGCRRASWTDARVLAAYPLCAQLAEVADAAAPEPLPWNLDTAACMQAWNRRIHDLLEGVLTPANAGALIAADIDQALASAEETSTN